LAIIARKPNRENVLANRAVGLVNDNQRDFVFGKRVGHNVLLQCLRGAVEDLLGAPQINPFFGARLAVHLRSVGLLNAHNVVTGLDLLLDKGAGGGEEDNLYWRQS
jgi:hypothetical protein